jgi:pyridoxine 5-phosphate synthase
MRLGVNVDHVATVREARKGRDPDPVRCAVLAEEAGADQITIHLREDRRHIQDRDLRLLREVVRTRLNQEMAATDEMISIALSVRPDVCTLVPEKREELTTEGGLDVLGGGPRIAEAAKRLREGGVRVSLFIDPDLDQVQASLKAGAQAVEIHTGRYADAPNQDEAAAELHRIADAAALAQKIGLEPLAGHGLDYRNVGPVCRIPSIVELNIGHSIVGRALSVGMLDAVREMIAQMRFRGPGREDPPR